MFLTVTYYHIKQLMKLATSNVIFNIYIQVSIKKQFISDIYRGDLTLFSPISGSFFTLFYRLYELRESDYGEASRTKEIC